MPSRARRTSARCLHCWRLRTARARRATALEGTDRERAVARLVQMLRGSDGRVIPAVLTALAKLQGPDIGKRLSQALPSDGFVGRTYAADNVGALKVDGAV